MSNKETINKSENNSQKNEDRFYYVSEDRDV